MLANASNPSHRLAWPVVEREARALKISAIRHEFAHSGHDPGRDRRRRRRGRKRAVRDARRSVGAQCARRRSCGEAAHHRLPAFYWAREFVDAGGLASYGQSLVGSYRSAGSYMARIKQGANPGQLPVEQPTRFEMVINLRAAQALDLAIPSSVLVGADDVLR